MLLIRRFSLTFFVLGLTFAAPVSAAVLERLEASVNNQLVLRSDYGKFRQIVGLRTQLDPLFNGTSLAAQGAGASDESIRDFLIDEKVIMSAFPVTDADVEAEVNSIQSGLRLSRDQLKQALKAQGYRFEEYFELIRATTAKRNLIDREIRTRVTISDDDVRNYYINHYSKGRPVNQAYRVLIVTSRSKDVIEGANKAINAGEPFAEVAKKYSEDSSAEHGGELGTLSEDQMSPTIRAQLKKLKVGESSGVLGDAKSQYFILHLADVKATSDAQMARVSDEIRAHLSTDEFRRQIALWLDRQRQTAFIHRAGEASTQGLPQSQ